MYPEPLSPNKRVCQQESQSVSSPTLPCYELLTAKGFMDGCHIVTYPSCPATPKMSHRITCLPLVSLKVP